MHNSFFFFFFSIQCPEFSGRDSYILFSLGDTGLVAVFHNFFHLN